MFERTRSGWSKLVRSLLLHCVVGAVLLTGAQSALASDDFGPPVCDPDIVASGGQIECEGPPPPPAPAPDVAGAPLCDETGASIGAAVARNLIGWTPSTQRRFDHTSDENVLSLNTGDRVEVTSGAHSGNVYEYLGTSFTISHDYTSSDSPDEVRRGQRVKRLAGVGGATEDAIFEYVGHTTLDEPDLDDEDYPAENERRNRFGRRVDGYDDIT